MLKSIKDDKEISEVLNLEISRQQDNLELIASENFVSKAVLEAAGSVLTNKYAEGYPGKRYYGGCEYVDMAENIARERLKKIFNAEYVNVQPHSGSQANMGVYMALLQPGDTILGLSLDHGGHLTHGSPVNFSGKIYHAVGYPLNKETKTLDYNIIDDWYKKTVMEVRIQEEKMGDLNIVRKNIYDALDDNLDYTRDLEKTYKWGFTGKDDQPVKRQMVVDWYNYS